MKILPAFRKIKYPLWGRSSAGRAPALQAGGHGFESHRLHQWDKSPIRDLRPILGNDAKHRLRQMFIENRIKYRNETDSCILRKTCYYLKI